MERDVTELFETYRECARHLRNTYFSMRDSKDWDTIEDFDEIAKTLFAQMVSRRLGERYDPKSAQAIEENRLLIVPSSSVRMPLMISRDKNGGGSWDHPRTFLEPGDAKIAFRNYFDWDEHALIDFRYYHGVVLASDKYPDIIEHEVLIETIYGRILFAATPVV